MVHRFRGLPGWHDSISSNGNLMAQTITLDQIPVDRIQIIVNGVVYIPNVTPGVTWTQGTDTVNWDETNPNLFLLDNATDTIIQETR